MKMEMKMVKIKTECDIPVPGIPVPGNSSISLMVSEPVSKKFGTEKSPGTGLEKIWYRKKSQNRYQKNIYVLQIATITLWA